MLEGWKINANKVHLVLRDYAANMAKAMREASLPSLGCFAHSLQLVVEDGVLSQHAVIDILAICSIIGHFKHSTVAYGHLCSIYIRTFRNSTTLSSARCTDQVVLSPVSVIEQKMSLAAYATETGITTRSPTQLDLAEKIVSALSSIEQLTKSISANCASVSLIIPFMKKLFKTLQKHHDDSGVRTMKSEMLCSLNQRFSSVGDNQHLVLASLLDPSFKNRFLMVQNNKQRPKKCC